MYEALFTDIHGLSLDRLKNFLLVVDRGSIADAAQKDLSTQSLISRQIKELEEFFKVKLTRRHGRTIQITDEGLELAKVVRMCLDGLQDYKLRQEGRKPLLRIGAGFSTMQWILTPHLKELSSVLKAELELVRIRSRDAATKLREGELDMAVVRADAIEPGDKRIQTIKLGKCGYAWFGAKDKALPLAVPTGGGQFEEALLEVIKDQNYTLIHCGSLLQMASLVIDEQACAVLPETASVAFRRMDWVEQKPFPKLKHYKREWVLAFSKRQLDARRISERQMKACAEYLKV